MEDQKQNAFARYLLLIVYVLLSFLIRLICLAPLAAIFMLKGSLKLIAVFCPLLILLVVLPLRFSFAEALTDPAFSLGKAFSFSRYTDKLKHSTLHALKILLWGIPMYALLGYFYYVYLKVDAMTILSSVKKIGLAFMNLPLQFFNLFRGLLGRETYPLYGSNTASLTEGILAILLIIGIVVLIWLYGAVRNSASRYLYPAARAEGISLSNICKRQLHGRRWAQLETALINLLLTVPFFVVAWLLLDSTLEDIFKNLLTYVYTNTLPVKELVGSLVPLSIDFAVLYLMVLPARRLLTARFANKSRKSGRTK